MSMHMQTCLCRIGVVYALLGFSVGFVGFVQPISVATDVLPHEPKEGWCHQSVSEHEASSTCCEGSAAIHLWISQDDP